MPLFSQKKFDSFVFLSTVYTADVCEHMFTSSAGDL